MTECYVTPELNQKEAISLPLTKYESQVIVHYLEKFEHEQLNEPHIKSICKKIEELV